MSEAEFGQSLLRTFGIAVRGVMLRRGDLRLKLLGDGVLIGPPPKWSGFAFRSVPHIWDAAAARDFAEDALRC